MMLTGAAMAEAGRKKGFAATRTPGAYFVGAMLAGAYVGVALILAWTCAAGLPAGVRPLVTGAVFGIGLLLVLFAGGEMFTGGVMYGSFGLAHRTSSILHVLAMLVIMWVGNLVGSLLVAWIFAEGGGGVLYSTPNYLHDVVAKKATSPPMALLARAALCNWLVCLAIWTPARLQNEAAKIIAMAWCLLAFVACGFEHSVANMTAFALALFDPTPVSTVQAMAYNLLWVTLGNLIGGAVFVSGAYLWYARTEAAAPEAVAAPAPPPPP